MTKNFYANGTPIVLSDLKNSNDLIGVTITYVGQSSSVDISKNDTTYGTDNKEVSGVIINVFGGSKDANVQSSNITVNGGLLTKIYGGGYGTSESQTAHVKDVTINVTGGSFVETSLNKYDSGIVGGGLVYSTVETVSIAMSGGSTQFLIGGGLHSSTGSSAGLDPANPYPSVSNKTTITVSGNADIDYLFGGAQGYGSVNESVINFNGGTTEELIGSGSNGKTLKTTINISGGTVTNYAFTVNRGAVADSATINVTNGTVAALYAGAAQESKDTTGTITGTTSLKVSGGNVSSIYLGLGLNDANVTIDIGNNTIYAQGGADGTANLFKDYTIASGKTWTLTNGTLEIKAGSLITNNGTLVNNGTVVVNDYKNLANAAKAGGKIQLGTNITSNVSEEPTKFLEKATLDLNGNTLTLNGMARIEVGAGGDLTITDSSTTAGKIVYTVASNENSAIKVAGTDNSNLAKLTLEKCEIVVNETGIENNKLNGYGVFAAGYCEIISGKAGASNEDVKITAGYSAISGNDENPNVKLTINSGTYESMNSAAVYFPCTGTLTVSDGKFTGKTGFDIRAGTVNISNAEITATGSYEGIAYDLDKTRTSIPTVWGMGIAIIDHPSYSENTPISVTLSKLTFTGTSTCDLYIGNFNQNTGVDAGKFNENNLDQTFTVNKKITVTVTDVLEYSVEKSANETSGYLIVNDLDTSSKTFTATNLFNKGDATVENNGTIVVNDLNDLINAAAIGGNIQLAANIEIKDMDSALELIDGTTLDLNGYTITIEKIGKAANEFLPDKTKNDALKPNANRIVIADNATVTIKDSVGTGKIEYTEDADVTGTYKVKSPIKVGSANSSTLILDNVTIESKEYGVVVFTNGSLTVNGGSITANVSAISGNGLESDCKITLNGGTYTSTTTAAIFFPSTANLTVNGGTFTGATGFDIRAGTVSITNAKIVINIPSGSTTGSTGTSGPSSWKMGVAVIDHSSYASGTAISVTISGTTVTGALYDLYIGDLNRNADGTFKGIDGTFNQNHSITVKVNGNTVYDKVAGSDYNRFTSDISSGSSGGGVPITPPTDDPEPEPIIPDENNNVTVPSIDDKKADELVHKAVSSGSDSISIIDASNVEGEYTEVTVSKSDLETISKKIENNNNINSVSIETSEGDIIIEKEVLNSILETTDADSVSFEIEDAKDKLTDEQKEAVGDRPVYDINIKAGNENITSFNGKTITISLPYTLKAGEDPENIVVYYVKEDGSLEKMNCTYKDGKVIFETDHLSKYVIGYEESDKPVTPDTPDNKKDDNNTIYYAVAAIVVILIIIALAYYFMKKKQ